MAKQALPAGVTALTTGQFMVDPRKIVMKENLNFRSFNLDNPDHATLKAQIKAQGLLKPLEVVFDNGVVTVVDGHLRLGAILSLIADGEQILRVKCILEDKDTTPEQRTINLITGNSAIPPTPLELGEILLRMRKFGWTAQKIAEAIGKTDRYVRGLWDLALADNAVKKRINKGVLAASLASKLLVKEEPAKAETVLKEAESIAPTEGLMAGKITEPVLTQAMQNVEKGTPGKKPSAKTGAKTPVAPPEPTAPKSAETARAAVKDKPVDNGKLLKPAAFRGPFAHTGYADVTDGNGKVICFGETPQHAVNIAYMLNIAAVTISRGDSAVAQMLAAPSASETTPVAPSAKPVARPAKPNRVGGKSARR